MDDSLLGDVEVIGVTLRLTLEEYIADWRHRHRCPVGSGEALTKDMCRGSAYGTYLALREHVPGVQWELAGGLGEGVGMVDLDGAWHGHFWVVGATPTGGRIIVDLTADQFGHEDVVITSGDDGRYRIGLDHAPIMDGQLTSLEKGWGEALATEYWLNSQGPRGP